MARITHSRCGTELVTRSGLLWCPACKEQPTYAKLWDADDAPPAEPLLGGGFMRTKIGSGYDDDDD